MGSESVYLFFEFTIILEKLAAGETVEQLLEAHPRLTKEGIQAALMVDFRIN